jgi:hypothetical protein
MSVEPRLLDVEAASAYLGNVSPWTLRKWIQKGRLKPVRLPSTKHKGRDGRRLLFDRTDLDRLIEEGKEHQ